MRDRLVGSLMLLTLSILWWSLVTDAQQVGNISRIGVLLPYASSEPSPSREAFRQALHDLGYVEGQNIGFEWRWAERRLDRLPDLAHELVRLNVDVILAPSTPAIRAAQHATTTIPIVMIDAGDPVEAGFVQSFARPGGNITGLTAIAPEVVVKQLELLKEALPGVTQMAVLGTPGALAFYWSVLQHTALALGVQLQPLAVRTPNEFERAFTAATHEGAGALIVLPVLLFAANERRLAELAAQSRLPAIFWRGEFAEVGGLMAYGASRPDLWRRAAAYVDEILKGAKPANLPVQTPWKYELIINLKVAQAMGLTIPPMLLMQATEVIK